MIPDSHDLEPDEHRLVGISLAITKGGQPRTVYPPLRLIDRTNKLGYRRRSRVLRLPLPQAKRRLSSARQLVVDDGRHCHVTKDPDDNLRPCVAAAGISGTLHWLRHIFAMVLLARLQFLARDNLRLMAAALARLAGISRNTLYANHRVVLDDLRELCLPRALLPDRPTPQSVEPTLPAVKAQLIAVTTQNAGLLQGALATEQRADQLESRNAQLVRQLRKLGLPTALNSPRSTSSD